MVKNLQNTPELKVWEDDKSIIGTLISFLKSKPQKVHELRFLGLLPLKGDFHNGINSFIEPFNRRWFS